MSVVKVTFTTTRVLVQVTGCGWNGHLRKLFSHLKYQCDAYWHGLDCLTLKADCPFPVLILPLAVGNVSILLYICNFYWSNTHLRRGRCSFRQIRGRHLYPTKDNQRILHIFPFLFRIISGLQILCFPFQLQSVKYN
jgi:hypothetical protein